jgi:hypothetical protein
MSDVQHDLDDRIGFNKAVFAWSKDAGDGTRTPSSRAFRLRIEDNITVKRNCINLIIGPSDSNVKLLSSVNVSEAQSFCLGGLGKL